MSRPAKLSDDLGLDARLTTEIAEPSIAGQIEFLMQLGRATEPILEGDRALALRRAGGVMSLTQLLSSVDSPAGRRRLAEYLAVRPFPHYEPAPGGAGLLVRVEEDGKRKLGRFVDREFREVE